ncbi:MAG: ADP-glyceromanno-heptose 6-epimerase [Gammaproteobacteria bacterium]|nr:MAG: ADP-glyceromanno-heptose 6-epimerase [Gammaproteobacteria bacterium]
MIVVTGGVGFIGSNLVKALNKKNQNDILVVDDLTDGTKVINLADCDIADYQDKNLFIQNIKNNSLPKNITAIVHLGACSSTIEWDGHFIMNNNYEYSKTLFHYAVDNNIQFIYASSASVYGAGDKFAEKREHEKPINMYAYSKFLFDVYVRNFWQKYGKNSQVVGLRYFNVYGPREQHKGDMSSVAYKLNSQIPKTGVAKLFKGTDGYKNGEQLRDFVYVGDTVNVKLWLLENPAISGIFNVGTGVAQSFKDVANAVIDYHKTGKIEYIDFPKHLIGYYQSYTQADILSLKKAGYDKNFKNVQQGVLEYLTLLNKKM